MATIVDLRDPNLSLPDYLLIDASILLASRSVPGGSPSARSVAAIQFLTLVRQACAAGRIIALVSILTLEECYFKIIQWRYDNDPALANQRAAVGQQLGIRPGRVGWHRLYKRYPQLIQNYYPDIQAFHQSVTGIPLTVIEPRDCIGWNSTSLPIEERMRYHIHSCCILPKDAYLFAIAERLGIQHIATLDRDFNRLGAGFTVYTVP
jgi:hypothetical protein